MNLRFLGTGTSSGVPVIGCDCDVCTSTDPRDNRTRTSAMLEFTDPHGQHRVILIDASPDLRAQALREDIRRIDSILITHNHVDHVWGLDEVRRYNDLQRQTINVYADDHTHGALRRVYQHIFHPETNVQQSFIAKLDPKDLTPGVPIELFGLTITPFTLLHGRLEILGFRFDSDTLDPSRTLLPLAYCTDVVTIPDDSRSHLSNLTTLVLDALRERPHPTHFTVGQALVEANHIGANHTYLVHMTHDLAHAQTNATLPSNVQLAHDGLAIPDNHTGS